MPNLYVALMHYPVVNKGGTVIASALTNLDLHDISRTAKTYGVKGVFIITPLQDQLALAEKILEHWCRGPGARYNPLRAQALELVHLKTSLAAAVEHIAPPAPARVFTIATCARETAAAVGYGEIRRRLAGGGSYLLMFGTAWGLAEEVIRTADCVLEPIRGTGKYNHLPVRSAAAVILDRLLGSEN